MASTTIVIFFFFFSQGFLGLFGWNTVDPEARQVGYLCFNLF